MSTRCNVIVTDHYTHLLFYRHSDGYPKGVLPSLTRFINLVKSGKIRDDATQAAGWLVLIGHEEYQQEDCGRVTLQQLEDENFQQGLYTWNVGAYEPTNELNGDIQYCYVVDLVNKTISEVSSWPKNDSVEELINNQEKYLSPLKEN